MKENEKRGLYAKFRRELDAICIPEILKCVDAIKISSETGETVGMMCVADENGWLYIDCLYIIPEYRQKGYAKAAVLDFYRKNRLREIRLHIIRKNLGARKFWNKIFDLECIERNAIDRLYMIKGLR